MKRLIAAACLLFCFGMLAAQTSVPIPQREVHGTFSAAAQSVTWDQEGTGVLYHQTSWTLGGTVVATGCTLVLSGSHDVSPLSYTAVITGNCAGGQTQYSSITAASYPHWKLELTVFSGGTSPTIDYFYLGGISPSSSTPTVTQGT